MPVTYSALIQRDFGLISDLIRAHANERPHHTALVKDEKSLDFASLNLAMDRLAASLQRDGLQVGDTIALCGAASCEYAIAFLGALRAGVAVAPLAPSSRPDTLLAMLKDSGAKLIFLDEPVAAAIGDALPNSVRCIALEGPRGESIEHWLAPPDVKPEEASIGPDAAFNIIYSSGTTGAPKGIVQPHRMRWAHVQRAVGLGYDTEAVTICSTPLYSNTTLVSFFPALAGGGTVVLLSKFDAEKFLELAQRHRATHTMLVPVQYQRIMNLPHFDRYDLSSFKTKFCTSAPFAPALKADILKRWPGGLIEYYGMTEGGGTCSLHAHLHPEKLHTVGQPVAGHDIRLIDEHDKEVARGEIGEVVGRSGAMMKGYHAQPEKTAEAEWYDPEGNRFIRTGDVGRFDEDGFLTLLDRKKDMIISGGFNIYPSDVEAVLARNAAVQESAVVGVVSAQWGETPVAFVVIKEGRQDSAESVRMWANERLEKTQRLSAVVIMSTLPRSPIGKVLKRELRDQYALQAAS